jgi:hypothetical protein
MTSAGEQEIITPPVDDAYIWENYSDNNYGEENQLYVGYAYGYINTLVKFELSEFSGVVVDSAYLRLYVYFKSGAFPLNDVYIGICDSEWDENSVTWNTRPDSICQDYISGPSSLNAWWEIDVTNYIQDWVKGINSNYGFQLGTTDTTFGFFYMRSKEYTDPDYYPELELNYHHSSIYSKSLGSIKSLFE